MYIYHLWNSLKIKNSLTMDSQRFQNRMATELEYSIIERLSVDEENGRTI